MRYGWLLIPAAALLGQQTPAQDPEALKAEVRAILGKKPGNPQAGELLAKLTERAPEDPEAHHLYGQWALLNHQEELCIAEESKALALTPEDNHLARVQIYTLIGLAEDQLNRPEKAEAAFGKALTANRQLPRPDPRSAYEYVRFLEKQANDEEARKVAEEILGWAPSFGPAHLSRARYLAREREFPKAIEAGEAALTYAADGGQQRAAHAFLAKTYFAAGKPEEAQKHQAWLEK